LFNPLLDRAIDNELIDQRVASLDYGDDAEVQMMLRLARLQILRQIFFSRLTKEAVTEEAIKAAYDERVAAMPMEEEVHARHILVSSEDEAKAVIAALGEDDADFATIAAEKSMGPSASKGGDIGYSTKPAMVPEFAEAAFAMEVGEVSKVPVQSQFGWHVIKVEDRRPTPVPTLDEMREEIVAGLQQAVVDDGVAELREGRKIERYAFDGSELLAADAPADSAAPAPAE
jgi:peptidyl-prolyl cis-trans isomerase C